MRMIVAIAALLRRARVEGDGAVRPVATWVEAAGAWRPLETGSSDGERLEP